MLEIKPHGGWDGSHYFDALRAQGLKAGTEAERMDCIRLYDWDGWSSPYEIDWKSQRETPEKRMARVSQGRNGAPFGCSE